MSVNKQKPYSFAQDYTTQGKGRNNTQMPNPCFNYTKTSETKWTYFKKNYDQCTYKAMRNKGTSREASEWGS